MNMRWPTPRTGPPSVSRQSVSRPRRSASASRVHRRRRSPADTPRRPGRRRPTSRRAATADRAGASARGIRASARARSGIQKYLPVVVSTSKQPAQQIVRVAQIVERRVAVLARRVRARRLGRLRPGAPPRPVAGAQRHQRGELQPLRLGRVAEELRHPAVAEQLPPRHVGADAAGGIRPPPAPSRDRSPRRRRAPRRRARDCRRTPAARPAARAR